MKKYVVVLALAALSATLSGCSSASQMKPDARLTAEADTRRTPDLRLVEAITAEDYRRNVVISPYGLRRLFGMLVLGARGRTHDQIVGALGVTDDSDATPLRLPGFGVRDGIWIGREYTTLPSYEAAIRARFDADVEHVDFSSPDASARIERWVSLATGGQIPRIPLDDASFVAIDALTYRVKWAQPFEPGNTKPGPFHAEDRTTMTPMMHRQITAAMFSDAQGKYLRLPFIDGNSMLIALPAKGLTASTLAHAIQVSDKQVKPVTVKLTLPRFTVSSHVDLLGPLDRMGMTSSFGRDADYSSIFGRPGVFLTEMYQEGAIAVDERGAKVAVVSVAAVDAGPTLLVTFKVDRPFAFVVEDAKTRQVLVAGDRRAPVMENAIALRPWSDDDLGILVQTLGDRAMMTHLGGIETAEQIAARHQRFLALPATEGMFTIWLGDACVGTIGYWETNSHGEPVYETGWFVLPDYGRRGIASESASQIVARARAQRRLRSLHAYPAVDNVPSNRVCEKAGFRNLGAQSFEYPKGHFMRCNDWAIDLE